MLVFIIVCPPWMLFVKPYLLYQEHKAIVKQKESQGGDFELAGIEHEEGSLLKAEAREEKESMKQVVSDEEMLLKMEREVHGHGVGTKDFAFNDIVIH